MNKKILIVDDDADILDALQLLLEEKGYKVTISMKGEYAEKLAEGKGELPDLIVLDIMLGDKDGRVICRKLKSSKRTMNIPVILVSAHSSSKQSSLEAKATSFLAKPFETKALLQAIENHL